MTNEEGRDAGKNKISNLGQLAGKTLSTAWHIIDLYMTRDWSLVASLERTTSSSLTLANKL